MRQMYQNQQNVATQSMHTAHDTGPALAMAGVVRAIVISTAATPVVRPVNFWILFTMILLLSSWLSVANLANVWLRVVVAVQAGENIQSVSN